ncbi:MAG: secretin N-terminal domain-containing protein, partial [Candidatus Omnitrophota bacterium]|nr:secretin N-terminal domain-containing protein [Candidatus Omnitrophota bacterium]
CLSFSKLSAQIASGQVHQERRISLDFQDAQLKDILKAFSMQSGLNFIASEALQDRTVTLYMDNVSLDRAMEELFKANNLSYEMDKEANIFVVKDWGKLTIETITKVFYLKHATVSSSSLKQEMSKYLTAAAEIKTGGKTIATGSTTASEGTAAATGAKWQVEQEGGITATIKKLLSPDGFLIEDFRTNSLIVTDTPNKIKVISEIIAALDVSVPQVLLEVEILDVSKSVVDKMGIKFSQTPLTASVLGASGSIGFPFKSWSKNFLTGAATERGTLNINKIVPYEAQLDFLRTQTDTKFLARPRILTLNNETAEIRLATNELIGIKTTIQTTEGTTTTTEEPERYDTGIILRVTPQINTETNEITIFVYPKIAEANPSNVISVGTTNYQYMDPEERSTKTVIKVQNKETVVLGGLIRNERETIVTKLPLLGDLPLIGGLFRHKSLSPNKERELLIFITPRIINGKDVLASQTKQQASIPLREQGTATGFDRKAIIAASLSAFEKK